jgi:hypothetical protein
MIAATIEKEHLPRSIKATFIETATIANGKKL